MRILQINDLHVAKEGEDAYGVDVRGNFLNMVERLQPMNADLLVINGDLCYRDGELEIYEWIKEKLAAVPVPLALTSGNHDDPELIAEVFELNGAFKEGELYYKKSIKGHTCLFLDTTLRKVSQPQLDWLEDELEKASEKVFLFMHHPPVLGGVPYMDKNHALINREEVQNLIHSFEGEVYVFSGHYHVDKIIQKKNMTVFITPACFFQIDQHEETFKVDHYRIGFREIRWEGCALQSSVHYL